jgi:DNA-directed RNA polymerase specialized sigma24 family protein
MISQWQDHKAQLRSYVSRRIDDADAIDDILQDVYIKASSNLHQLASKGSLNAWLYRIAHNTIMDFYRKLGLSLSGAKSRIQRGRVKFRQHMMACCDFEINQEGITDYSPKHPSKRAQCE